MHSPGMQVKIKDRESNLLKQMNAHQAVFAALCLLNVGCMTTKTHTQPHTQPHTQSHTQRLATGPPISRKRSTPTPQWQKLSSTDKLKVSTKLIANIKKIQMYISALLEKEVSNNDHIAVSCLSDQLNRAKALLLLSKRAHVQLHKANLRSDAPRINHEFLKIWIAKDRAKKVKIEANICK